METEQAKKAAAATARARRQGTKEDFQVYKLNAKRAGHKPNDPFAPGFDAAYVEVTRTADGKCKAVVRIMEAKMTRGYVSYEDFSAIGRNFKKNWERINDQLTDLVTTAPPGQQAAFRQALQSPEVVVDLRLGKKTKVGSYQRGTVLRERVHKDIELALKGHAKVRFERN